MRVLMTAVPADYFLRGFVALALVVGRVMLGSLVPRGGHRRVGSPGRPAGRQYASPRRR
jgi:hypothetical protein